MTQITEPADTIEYTFQEERAPRPEGLMPPGRYNAIVYDIETKTGRKSGKPYQALTFEVFAGSETSEIDPAWAGTRVYCNAPWMYGNLLKACDFAPEDAKPGDTVKVSRSNLIEFPVVLEVKRGGYKKDDGTWQEQVEVVHIFNEARVPPPVTQTTFDPGPDLPF